MATLASPQNTTNRWCTRLTNLFIRADDHSYAQSEGVLALYCRLGNKHATKATKGKVYSEEGRSERGGTRNLHSLYSLQTYNSGSVYDPHKYTSSAGPVIVGKRLKVYVAQRIKKKMGLGKRLLLDFWGRSDQCPPGILWPFFELHTCQPFCFDYSTAFCCCVL